MPPFFSPHFFHMSAQAKICALAPAQNFYICAAPTAQAHSKKRIHYWRRFEINIKNKTVKFYDLLRPTKGTVELPTYNKNYEGIKENCFTYLA